MNFIEIAYFSVIMNNKSDTTAIVAVSMSRREIVVAYRGTMNIWNGINDLTVVACPYSNAPGVKIHAGFQSATMSLYEDVSRNGNNESFEFM